LLPPGRFAILKENSGTIEMAGGTGSLGGKAWRGAIQLLVLLALLLFVSAGSLRFWQAWIFWLVFAVAVLLIGLYFLKRDPGLVERRMHSGPRAEKEKSQKIIVAALSFFFVAEIVVPGFDRRFHWSSVPVFAVAAGDLLVAVGFVVMFLALRENSFASAAIEVDPAQKVVATGPYRMVRHPYYAGALLMELFTPLALGSYWGLLAVPFTFLTIFRRLFDEERFLAGRLPGYDEYLRRTRYRLIPRVW
jgi:protein-S-isoprenylcysteine O-methyltransferase Ste14